MKSKALVTRGRIGGLATADADATRPDRVEIEAGMEPVRVRYRSTAARRCNRFTR
jgi:hypothetical protein